MWLASYLVHVRKVRWQAGAAWLHGHLLDGDLASNSLSWQWVAGTFSSRPYLFNNDNVARHAPALALADTAIDADYEALERLARSPEARGAEPEAPARGVAVPGLMLAPPAQRAEPLPEVAGRRVALVHPWMLGRRPDADVVLGVLHPPYHRRFPWSARRWSFVLDLMRPLVDQVRVGDLGALRAARADAGEVATTDTLAPGYREALARVATRVQPVPRHFPDPPRLMRSFSQWWTTYGPGRLPTTGRRA
jgi:deoxyribodipyrimidine photo-lyase